MSIKYYPELSEKIHRRIMGSSQHIIVRYNMPFSDYESALIDGEEYFSLAAAGGTELVFKTIYDGGFSLKCVFINGEKCDIGINDFQKFANQLQEKVGTNWHDVIKVCVLAGLCHDHDEEVMLDANAVYMNNDNGGEISVEELDENVDNWRHPEPFYNLATVYINVGVGDPDEAGCFEEYCDGKSEFAIVATFDVPEEESED